MLKFKFGLRSRLGLIPGTSRLEVKDLELRKEYEEFLHYKDSGEYKRFQELEDIVNSQDFADRIKETRKQRFRDTEAYTRLAEYREKKKSPEFKGYFRITSSKEFNDFKRLENSTEIKEFEELERYVRSGEFKAVKKLKFNDSEEWQKYREYKRLSQTPEVKDYFKIKHSGSYKALKELEGSKKLSHFEELHDLVSSSEFIVMKKTLSSKEFKETPEYAKYQEYLALKSEPDIKAYQKIQDDKAFANFRMLENSSELEKLLQLEKFVNSPDFRNAKKEFELRKAAELHKLNDYKTLKKSVKIKAYYKIKNSGDLDYYYRLQNSPELEKYLGLENYINSQEFKETKALMESRDRFKKSAEYRQLQEYRELKNSSRLKWYNKLKNSDKFDELKKWKLVFVDDFPGGELDKSKWLTSFYWGNKLISQGYSLAGDRHLYTESGNSHVENSHLRLTTKKEPATGQAWDESIGFFPKDFEYTSALVNTGESFRQKYGAFEAKVRMRAAPSVFHAFWMLSDRAVPHIDIFRFSGQKKNSIELNNYWQTGNETGQLHHDSNTIGGIDFSKGFFIFRFEWYPDKMVWKINNTVIRKEYRGVPQEPMYILFSSGVEGDQNGAGLPTSFDIDWVRCFELVEEPGKAGSHK